GRPGPVRGGVRPAGRGQRVHRGREAPERPGRQPGAASGAVRRRAARARLGSRSRRAHRRGAARSRLRRRRSRPAPGVGCPRASGPQAITELMTKTLSGRQGMSYHIITNPIIKLDGDSATTDVMWTVIVKDEAGKPHVSMLGRHRDTVVRQRGDWKFKRREGY